MLQAALAVRYYLSPRVGDGDTSKPNWEPRRPKVSTIPDPAIPPYQVQEDDEDGNLLFDADGNPVMMTIRKTYAHASVELPGDQFLSVVVSEDFSALDADPEIEDVLEGATDGLGGDIRAALANLKGRNWRNEPQERTNKIKAKLQRRGFDVAKIKGHWTLYEKLKWLGRHGSPAYDPDGEITTRGKPPSQATPGRS